MRAAERAEATGPSTVRGDLTIERFTEATGLELETGPYETVAGYLIARLGRLAVQGDAVEVEGARLTALVVRRRRIVEVRVEWQHPAATASGGA
jgi:putative hemolysin